MKFLLETHAHTAEVSSCSHLRAAELVRVIHGAGYAGTIITDHFLEDRMLCDTERKYIAHVDWFLRGYRAAREEGEKLGFAVLFGMEIRLTAGPEDYLVYGLEPGALAELHGLLGQTCAQAKRRIDDLGGLLVQAHPYRMGQTIQPPECLHGVEVMNGNPRHDSRNNLALAYADAHGLLMTAGGDVHQVQDAGRGGFIFGRPVTTSADFARALLAGEGQRITAPG